MSIDIRYLREIGVSKIDFRSFFYCVLFDEYVANRNAKILDLWAGQGRNILSLKRFWYTNLFACDMSNFFQPVYDNVNIPLAVVDLENEKLPYEDSTFDCILLAHVIEHLRFTENALTEIKRILKKDGILMIETPDYVRSMKTFWNDYTHVRPYTKTTLHRLAKAYGFKIEIIKNSQIWDLILNAKFALNRLISRLQGSWTEEPDWNIKINMDPISIPTSITLMRKYFPWVFFAGKDMIGILRNMK